MTASVIKASRYSARRRGIASRDLAIGAPRDRSASISREPLVLHGRLPASGRAALLSEIASMRVSAQVRRPGERIRDRLEDAQGPHEVAMSSRRRTDARGRAPSGSSTRASSSVPHRSATRLAAFARRAGRRDAAAYRTRSAAVRVIALTHRRREASQCTFAIAQVRHAGPVDATPRRASSELDAEPMPDPSAAASSNSALSEFDVAGAASARRRRACGRTSDQLRDAFAFAGRGSRRSRLLLDRRRTGIGASRSGTSIASALSSPVRRPNREADTPRAHEARSRARMRRTGRRRAREVRST